MTMAFSPDGSMLAVSVSSKGVSLVQDPGRRDGGRVQAESFSMSYSRDGSRILLMSENRVELLDAD